MKKYSRFFRFISLLVVLGFFGSMMVSCGIESLLGPPLTSEQIAQIEAVSQKISNVLQQADDPFSPETLEVARQVALSQPAVEEAIVEEDSLAVKYKNGGWEVWVGDIPKPTLPPEIPEYEGLTRSLLREVQATGIPVGPPNGIRKAVLINALADDPPFASVKEAFDSHPNSIRNILSEVGFQVDLLYGGQANIENLKKLSDYCVILMFCHGGRGLLTFAYGVQTGEPWSKKWLTSSDWLRGRVILADVPWGEGDEKTREKHFRSFVTGSFWEHYY